MVEVDRGSSGVTLELAAATISAKSGEEAVSTLSAVFQDAGRAIEDRVSRGAAAT